ncbi:hypothetical protein KFL_010150070 [Klebsormidium nitens]|uniref:Uncharacterized protein n=1 Tax=Klebsormidium nitens TaxID=105231 RepID=A0A1Y1ISE5_KLENI|nr:hypothetical protein KFL_010150070 [Klebsormidium nitens]|eukprot:GAQ92449.1 hypothetical protein KFL_010150070 [Klebsormidium nitens]
MVDAAFEYILGQEGIVYVFTDLPKTKFKATPKAIFELVGPGEWKNLPTWAWDHGNFLFLGKRGLTPAVRERLRKSASRLDTNRYPKVKEGMAASNISYSAIVRRIGKGDPFQSWVRNQRLALSETLRSARVPISVKRERVMYMTAAVYNLFKVIARQNPRLLRRGLDRDLQAAANHASRTQDPQTLARVHASLWRVLLELDSAVKRSNVPLDLFSMVPAAGSKPFFTEVSETKGVSWEDIKEQAPPRETTASRGLSWDDVPSGRIEGMSSDAGRDLLRKQNAVIQRIREERGVQNSKGVDSVMWICNPDGTDPKNGLLNVLHRARMFASTGVLDGDGDELPYMSSYHSRQYRRGVDEKDTITFFCEDHDFYTLLWKHAPGGRLDPVDIFYPTDHEIEIRIDNTAEIMRIPARDPSPLPTSSRRFPTRSPNTLHSRTRLPRRRQFLVPSPSRRRFPTRSPSNLHSRTRLTRRLRFPIPSTSSRRFPTRSPGNHHSLTRFTPQTAVPDPLPTQTAVPDPAHDPPSLARWLTPDDPGTRPDPIRPAVPVVGLGEEAATRSEENGEIEVEEDHYDVGIDGGRGGGGAAGPWGLSKRPGPADRKNMIVSGPGRDSGCILQASGDTDEELVEAVLEYIVEQEFVVFVITNIAKDRFRKVNGAYYVVPPSQALRLLPDWAWKHGNFAFIRPRSLTDAIRLRLQKAKNSYVKYGQLYPRITFLLSASEAAETTVEAYEELTEYTTI